MIGVGIFTTPGIVYGYVPDATVVLFLWAGGGLYAFVGAHAYAQLAVKYPSSGGEYLFISKVIHPFLGFLSGWASLIAGFSGAIAASAVGAVFYLNKIVGLGSIGDSIAILFIGLITIVQVTSIKGSALLNRYLTLIVVVIVLIIGLVGVFGNPISILPSSEKMEFSLILSAFIPILFTYSGWNAAVYLAEEIKDPERNIRKALLGGTVVVITVYLLLNFLYLSFIPGDLMSGQIEIGHQLATVILGEKGAVLIDVFIILALLSSVSAMIMAGPRVYFAMSRDGYFPSMFKKIHSRFNTPLIAIVIQSVWSIVLVLTGTFESILMYTGFALILFSMIAVLSAVILINDGEIDSTFGWIFAYLLFILISVAILINSFVAFLTSTLIGLAIILAGGFIYWFYHPKRVKS